MRQVYQSLHSNFLQESLILGYQLISRISMKQFLTVLSNNDELIFFSFTISKYAETDTFFAVSSSEFRNFISFSPSSLLIITVGIVSDLPNINHELL